MAFVDAANGCNSGALESGGESREIGSNWGLGTGEESAGPKIGDDEGEEFTDDIGDECADCPRRYMLVFYRMLLSQGASLLGL
jgi:hypothetical protein